MISGVTGQDGAYLSEILLAKGYKVIGLKRRSSLINTSRVDHLYDNTMFHMEYWDSDDPMSLVRYMNEYEPNEFYHLSCQSHVKVSFDIPEHTFNSVALSTLRILEAIRNSKRDIKYYQASSSEMFGSAPAPQNELTKFEPQSVYACAKVASYYLTRNYRDAHKIFACNGILFNHESSKRGETFVTRKITMAAAKIKLGLQDKLYLGNLNAIRDWGHAKDYMNAAYLIMQYDMPEDFVIATNEIHSVREFCTIAFQCAGINIEWQGSGYNEVGIDKNTNKIIVEVSAKYYRPTEVNILQGDYSRAYTLLNWKPIISFEQLIEEMVESDINLYAHN